MAECLFDTKLPPSQVDFGDWTVHGDVHILWEVNLQYCTWGIKNICPKIQHVAFTISKDGTFESILLIS